MKKDFLFLLLFISIISIGVYTIKVDRVPPVISIMDNIELEYNVGSEVPNIFDAVYIEDNDSSDVEFTITYNVDMDKIGTHVIHISATDESGNTSEKSVEIYVKDLVAPQISGAMDLYYVLNNEMPDYVSHLSVYDLNEEITTQDIIVDDSNVDYNVEGVYDVFYIIQEGDNVTKVRIKLHVVSELSYSNVIHIGDTFNMKTQEHIKSGVYRSDFLEDAPIVAMMGSSGSFSNSTSSINDNIVERLESLIFHNPVLEIQYKDVMEYIENNYELSDYESLAYQFIDVSYARSYIVLQYSYDLIYFQEDVSNVFTNALEQIDNNEMTYNDFFDQFGTHVITEVTDGKKYSLVCIELNEQFQFLYEDYPCDYNSLSLEDIESTSFSVSETNSVNILSVTKTGMNPLIKTSELNSDVISSWYQENEEYVVIEFGPDNRGLKPIYQAIPDEYEHLRSIMEEALNEYLN